MPKLLIQPPLAGIQRFTGLQNRPSYTAYSLLNMWPIDPLTGHSIIASRPPLATLTAPATSCTLLQNVSGIVALKPAQSFLGAFNGSLYWWNGTGFTAAGGGVTVSSTTPVYCGTVFDDVFIPRAGTTIAVFDYTAGTAAAIVATGGTPPDDVFFLTEWNGALVAVTNDEPHLLQMSRVGDPRDWDYSVSLDDEYAAWSSSVTTPGGTAQPINAFARQTDDTAIISTTGGTFLLRGHPRDGGTFDKILDTYMLGQGAWCAGADGTVYFLTPDGMYAQPPGQGTIPTPISKNHMPEELLGLDYVFANPVVSMVYDSRWNGVMIQVRGAQEQAWRYDIKTGGFFREEFVGYPFVMLEHQPFITDQTSGVLLGGVNLRYFDKFGTEEFESSGLIGPVKISGSNLEKSKIIKLRAVFGTDTPTDDGTLAVAVGLDAQDALNRALLGEHQYRIALSNLKTNNGTCYPHVSGSAAVVEFAHNVGRISFEGIELDLEEAGANRMPRGTQIVPTGEDIDFTEPSNEFDSLNWIGYSQATPNVPNCTLPDFTHWIDLSELPSEWWDNVLHPLGGDLRITDNNNLEYPRDLIAFDLANETGFVALKLTQQSPPTPVRVWIGNPFVGDYDPTDAFGRHNAYDANWRAFYPYGGCRDSGEADRTQYANNLTLTGADSTCLDTGPIGVQASDYTHLDPTNNFGRATTSIPATAYPTTFVAVVKDPDNTSLPCFGLRDQSGPSTANVELTANRDATNQRADAGSTAVGGAPASEDQSNSLANSANFRQFVAVIAGNASRTAYIDGGNDNAPDITDVTIASGVLDEIVIGKGARSGLSASSTTAEICLAQVHDTARSACWINYQYQMLDQVDFWNTWGAFVQVNDPDDINPPDPAPADTTTCPTGFVTPVETGTWSGFCSATPDPPASNMNNWVHWIDLSDMHASWWSAVSTSGNDIRATDQLNRFIPLDLIEFNKVANTGFACVRLNQSDGVAQQIRLWVGNATAITLTRCAIYGRYRVYDENYVGFWPSGGGNDRTGNQNNMTAVGATVGGVTGPIGNTATNYSGSTYSTDVISAAIDSYPTTMAAVIRTTNFTQQGAIISAVRSQFQSHDTLMHKAGSAPGRYSCRANDITYDAVSTTTVSSNTWTHECGMSENNVRRSIVVAGGTQFFSPLQSLPSRSFSRISIGARRTGGGDIFWNFTGDIGLVSVHKTLRATDNSWAAYQAAMLDQNAFYNLGGSTWAWTAQVSSLPQP